MSSNTNSLGARMLQYENVSKLTLTKRMPLVIRIDGRAFHTWTHGLNKPFDEGLANFLATAAKITMTEMSGAKLAYLFSDEISILLTDYDALTTDAWFDKEQQKLCSVTASIFTAHFNALWFGRFIEDKDRARKLATFDARCFLLPKEEVANYFVFRQQDCTRNSINGLGQAHFSHVALQGKSTDEVQEMLFTQKSLNWNDLETRKKRGSCVVKSDSGFLIDEDIPVFTQDRDYIERFVIL